MQERRLNIVSGVIFIANVVIFIYLTTSENGKGDGVQSDNQIGNLVNSIESIKEELTKINRPSVGNDFKELAHKLDMMLSGAKVSKYDFSHLKQETPYVVGPVQDDEAIFLYGLVKTLRPKTVIEFGFWDGDSALNFLKALDSDAKMFSFDIQVHNPNADALKDPRFKMLIKSQTEFTPADIENRLIDIAFLDAEHTMQIQVPAFEKIINHLSPTAILIIHDSGLHVLDNVRHLKCVCDFPTLCGSMHQPGERLFINWITANHPQWEIINLQSFETYRHGLTIMQRKYNLSTQEVDKSKCTFV